MTRCKHCNEIIWPWQNSRRKVYHWDCFELSAEGKKEHEADVKAVQAYHREQQRIRDEAEQAADRRIIELVKTALKEHEQEEHP